jgi:hypothetical protein
MERISVYIPRNSRALLYAFAVVLKAKKKRARHVAHQVGFVEYHLPAMRRANLKNITPAEILLGCRSR